MACRVLARPQSTLRSRCVVFTKVYPLGQGTFVCLIQHLQCQFALGRGSGSLSKTVCSRLGCKLPNLVGGSLLVGPQGREGPGAVPGAV